MTEIMPTNKEVFQSLKRKGCIWAYGSGCECYSGIKNQGCFGREKIFLTRVELTEDEINEGKEQNKKVMAELNEWLNDAE